MGNIDLNSIGNLISKMRNDKQMTQQQFAEALNVTKSAVSQWENGNSISADNIQLISRYFGVSISELVSGKLKTESNIDYWKRNYDLNSCEFAEISDDTIDVIKMFYERCTSIKARFNDLVIKIGRTGLQQQELDEFKYLKRYFKIDYQYYLKKKNSVLIIDESNEAQFVRDIVNEFQNDIDSLRWEISKVYDFVADSKFELVSKSKNERALSYYLSSLSQPERDLLFMTNLFHEVTEKSSIGESKKIVKYTIDEIEQIPFFKTMLNSGCNCMLTFNGIDCKIDEEQIEFLEGEVIVSNITKNKSFDDLGSFVNFSGGYNYEIIKNWKLLSLPQYKELVDYEKTKYLKSLVNDKNDNPLKYYNTLLEFTGELK